MEKSEIFTIIKMNVLKVLDMVQMEDITPEASLRDLGANSIDRAEIIMMTLEAMQLRVARMEFAKAKNIDDLCSILSSKHAG